MNDEIKTDGEIPKETTTIKDNPKELVWVGDDGEIIELPWFTEERWALIPEKNKMWR